MCAGMHHMTAEELIQLPRGRARYELLRGKLQTMPLSGSAHGIVCANVAFLLGQYVANHHTGVVLGAGAGFLLERNPDTVLAPDAAFIGSQRIPASGLPDAYWPGPPDLAVEVVSPDEPSRGVAEKGEKWLQAGTETIWIVNVQSHSVEVCSKSRPSHSLSAEDTLDGGLLLPGFECRVADLFWHT